MKSNRAPLLLVPLLLLASSAIASTTWYVNGAKGSDSNSCTSRTTACKTIGHAISLASSGDSIKIAAATYAENLTIGFSLKVIGSGAKTTIIDGGALGTVGLHFQFKRKGCTFKTDHSRWPGGGFRCGYS